MPYNTYQLYLSDDRRSTNAPLLKGSLWSLPFRNEISLVLVILSQNTNANLIEITTLGHKTECCNIFCIKHRYHLLYNVQFVFIYLSHNEKRKKKHKQSTYRKTVLHEQHYTYGLLYECVCILAVNAMTFPRNSSLIIIKPLEK